MTLPTNRISRCIVLGILCALLTPLPSYASEQPIETFYADRFERLTGYPPTEEGVRSVLALFETRGIHPTHRYAAISVVGERKLTGLVDDLKAIYHRQPEDVPLEFKFLYKSPGTKDRLQALIARALIRCGDPEGETFTFDLLSRSNYPLVVIEAVRNLRVMVEEFGTDVSSELESILNLHVNRSDKVGIRGLVFMRLIRELDEIIEYTKRTGCPGYSKYAMLVYESRETLSTSMRWGARKKLKVLATEFGTDVSDEFEFLFEWCVNLSYGYLNLPDGYNPGITEEEKERIIRVTVLDLLQEIYDIRRYTELSGCPNRRIYEELITRIHDDASDDVLSAIDSFDSEYVPRWREIHGLRGQLSVAKKFQSMRQR